MPIPPIQAVGALLAVAPLAEAALTSVSATFADLLSTATSKDGDSPDDAKSAAVPFGLEGLTGSQPGSSVGSLQAQTDSLLRQFHELLQNLLGENEIDTGSPLQLQADENGQVRVNGDHPEAFRIENLFAANAKLSGLFNQISANTSLLQAIEAAGAFQREQSNEQLPGVFPDRQTQLKKFSLNFGRERATVVSN